MKDINAADTNKSANVPESEEFEDSLDILLKSTENVKKNIKEEHRNG